MLLNLNMANHYYNPNMTSNYGYGIQNNRELRIVMMGKTGIGKSATGNTILGRKCFELKFSGKSMTVDCAKGTTGIDGQHVAVIDTPGLFDTRFGMDKTTKDVGQCISFAAPGPHVFLVVIKLGRFTDEEKQTVQKIQEIFGQAADRYSLVLFTHGDCLGDTTIEDFLVESPDLQELVTRCNGQYHVFNNKNKDRSQVTELLQKIRNLTERNGGSHYTNAMFQEAERKIEEEKQRILKEKREEIRKEREEMERKMRGQYEDQMRRMNDQIQAERERERKQREEERKRDKEEMNEERRREREERAAERQREREEMERKMREQYEEQMRRVNDQIQAERERERIQREEERKRDREEMKDERRREREERAAERQREREEMERKMREQYEEQMRRVNDQIQAERERERKQREEDLRWERERRVEERRRDREEMNEERRREREERAAERQREREEKERQMEDMMAKMKEQHERQLIEEREELQARYENKAREEAEDENPLLSIVKAGQKIFTGIGDLGKTVGKSIYNLPRIFTRK